MGGSKGFVTGAGILQICFNLSDCFTYLRDHVCWHFFPISVIILDIGKCLSQGFNYL